MGGVLTVRYFVIEAIAVKARNVSRPNRRGPLDADQNTDVGIECIAAGFPQTAFQGGQFFCLNK